MPTPKFWPAARVWVCWALARFPYKNKRKRTDEGGKTGFDQEQPKSFMNSFNLALCLTPRRVAGGGGPGLVRLCVVARPFTKTKGSGQTKRERLLYCIRPLVFSKRPLKIISAHWVDSGLKKNLEIISAQWVDSGFAKIKLKLRAPNGWISACGQVKKNQERPMCGMEA